MGYKDVTKRSAVIAAIKECDAKGRDAFLKAHGFRRARLFFLIYDGAQYDSKAILGVAHGKQFGKNLTTKDFSGGEDTVKPVLESMGFEVVEMAGSRGQSGKNDARWSDAEMAATVSAYLQLLQMANSGKPANKAETYRALSKKFGRTPKAFEYRMQNISYVLTLLGRRWIKGLPPAKNVGVKNAVRLEGLILAMQGQVSNGEVAEIILAKKVRSALGSVAPKGSRKPPSKQVTVTKYVRDLKVREWVLKEADGTCECCGSPAPFKTADGPFLEVHHVLTLAEGGSDTICNAVALCPNCHRRLHFAIDSLAVIEAVYKRVSRLKLPALSYSGTSSNTTV